MASWTVMLAPGSGEVARPMVALMLLSALFVTVAMRRFKKDLELLKAKNEQIAAERKAKEEAENNG